MSIQAQKKKAAATKKPDVKKTQAKAKDAKKDSAKAKATAKNAKKDTKDNKASAKAKDEKKEKLTAKEKAKQKNSKPDPKKLAAARKAEAERKRAEEARRQAALAEQRRREQAAREARARKIAFERGLRTETIANIENDKTDGEDLAIRRAAVNALGSHAGTIVVMEAQTGKIVTMVNQDWAIRDGFKPCSTIKLVTAVGGINENVINDEGGIGKSTSGMNLNDALAFSNNGYFQRVGSNMGNSKMIGYAKSLGLGEPTGINAQGETAGKLPHGNKNARIYSHGDDFEVTPLQLAVMVSAISNGGRKVVPQIPRPRSEKAAFVTQLTEQVNVPQRNVEGVLPGMVGAAVYGTARRGVDSSMGIAGKTGSCIGQGSWVGLFASVAPVEDPKYSVVVITRGQSERGRYAAAIAGKIYQALRPRISRNIDKALARRLMKPIPAVDLNTASRLDEEEEEDAEEINSGDEKETPIIVGSNAKEVPVQPKKLIQKTTQSKPSFPPVVITFDKSGREKTRPRIVKNK
ncbi:MAG: penicillin-binding transpeptidase domain-containing protein [Pyrinomonadaceae bacterium]